MMDLRRLFLLVLALLAPALLAGALKVSITPAAAITAGAQWRVDGGTWRNSAATVNGLAAGTHRVEFKPVSGWLTPASLAVTVPWWGTATATTAYLRPATAKVTLTPSSGQWRLDNGAWIASGGTVAGIAPGNHVISYNTLNGYTAPATETVALAAGQNLTLARSYTVQFASLAVTLSQPAAQWRLDGGAWQPSGYTLGQIPPGAHSLSFSSVTGFSTPPSETVVLANQQQLALTRTYDPLPGSLTISLDPTQAQWRTFPLGDVPAGNWLASGATAGPLPAGSYQVEYKSLADHTAPATEVVVVAPGAAVSLARAYTYDPAFAVVHSFSDTGSGIQTLRGSDGRIYGIANTGGPLGSGFVFTMMADGSAFTVLRSFAEYSGDGLAPNALVEGLDGVLYGITMNGGNGTNSGTVFRLNRDGTGYAIIRSFVAATEGTWPNSLIEGSDGVLYGTTLMGSGSQPRVFRLNHDGSGYSVLQALPASSNPCGLTEGSGGLLYGANQRGGAASSGTIFWLRKDGTGYTTIKNFAGGADGATPAQRVTIDPDGWIYGVARSGGTSGRGLVFRLAPDGSAYTVLHHFTAGATDGGIPYAQLALDENRTLLGVTFMGGPANVGSLFRLNRDGTGYTTVRFFNGDATVGGRPNSRVLPLDATHLLCTTSYGAAANSGALLSVDPSSGAATVLRACGAPAGNLPMAPLTSDATGRVYGTTYSGGAKSQGTLFSVDPDGSNYTVLHHFMAADDGSRPLGAVVAGSDGFIYGAAQGAGSGNYGCLYKVAADGSTFAVIHSFVATAEGAGPQSVTEGRDGLLYGTTATGGSFNLGTVFRVGRDGSGYTVLHHFEGQTNDGQIPYSALLEGADGRLYGTTSAGGSAGAGTIYAIARDGTGYTILHHFGGGTSDGSIPWGNLTQTADGVIFGTTNSDAVNPTVTTPTGLATVFSIHPDGSGYSVLKTFARGAPYYSGVVEHGGRLYGTCSDEGTFGRGTVFSIKPDGTDFSVLVNFGAGPGDPAAPAAGVVCSPEGILHGTTAYGVEGGAIFRLRLD